MEEDDECVTPYQLCDVCKAFIGKLEFLTFSLWELQEVHKQYLPFSAEHYPDLEALVRGSKALCHLCSLIYFKKSHRRSGSLLKLDRNEEVVKNDSIIAYIYWRYPFLLFNYRLRSGGNLGDFKINYSEERSQARDDTDSWRWATSNSSHQVCDFIKSATSRCQSEHKACNVNIYDRTKTSTVTPDQARQSRMPMRLVDLNHHGERHDLQLVLSEQMGRVDYVTVSYTWGGVPPFMLTDHNEKDCLEGFSTNQLSRTFRDAVYLTRRLGFRYIWIDAVCIRQLDPEEWQHEGSRMGEIYSGSVLTLSASDSPNCEAGFSLRRRPLQTLGCRLHLRGGSKWCLDRQRCQENHVEDEVLQSRGWAFQERALSPRTIHIGANAIRWECRESFMCEVSDHLGGCNCIFSRSTKNWPALISSSSEDNKNSLTEFYRYWDNAVNAYAKTNLSQWTDRSIALSGLGSCLQRMTGYSCSFGVWLESLPEGLIWASTSFAAQRLPNQAPTWSWLSLKPKSLGRNLTITSGLYFYASSRPLKAFYRAKVTKYPKVKNFEEPTPEFWKTDDYHVGLQCRACKGKYHVRIEEDSEEPVVHMIVPELDARRITLDDQQEAPTNGEPGWFLLLAKTPNFSWKGLSGYRCDVLVVVQSPSKPGIFRRIGICNFVEDDSWKEWDEQEFEIE